MAAFDLPEAAFEVVVIKTTGDRVQDRPLKEIGGKGLFTKEIEEALLDGGIDVAVHSSKDMPTAQPDGLVLDAFLPREDPRDAFVTLHGGTMADLPDGSVVGTSSLRRRAQLGHRRPGLRVVEFRGNLQTRMGKLRDGVADATFLALAGLNRLEMTEVARQPIDPGDMLPALAQGAIGLERRVGDGRVEEMVAAIHDAATGTRIACERAFLTVLDGSCETPIAGLAQLDGAAVTFRGGGPAPRRLGGAGDGGNLRPRRGRGAGGDPGARVAGAGRTRLLRLAGTDPQARRARRSSRISNGTPGTSFAPRITREVFTLATLSAAVSSPVRKDWNVLRSGATHFRMKSISPFSM